MVSFLLYLRRGQDMAVPVLKCLGVCLHVVFCEAVLFLQLVELVTEIGKLFLIIRFCC